MKECFKCHRVLPLDEFYKHPRMADGHLNKCKECNKRDVHENYYRRHAQYAEYERERYQQENRRQYTIAQARLRNIRNPQKRKARTALGNAIRDGRIKREPCQFCGDPKSEAHHRDYSKPLDVVWACFKCHREQFHGQTVMSSFDACSSQA